MIQPVKRFLLLLMTWLLAACSPWHDLPLLQLDMAALGPARAVQQRLAITWNDKTHVLENMLEIDPDGLSVVGLAMGMRVYSFDYDGQTLQAGAGHLPAGLSEQQIANDLLLIHAPLDALNQALPAGWRCIEQTLEDDQRQRSLQQNEKTVIRVQYHAGAPWQGRSVLTHQRRGYQLTLDSASEP